MLSRQELAESVAQAAEREFGFTPEVPLEPISPPRPWGLSSPLCLRYASEMGNPQESAEALAEALASELPSEISEVSAENGFINFYFDPSERGAALVREIAEGDFGRPGPRDERVMVEFSQPNTHKSFHVGHLRNALLGNALSNLLSFTGREVIRSNYYGDIGLHVVKCLWGLKHLHRLGLERGEEESQGRFLGRVYTAVSKLLKEDNEAAEAAEEQIRQMHRDWDQGDSGLRELWEQTRQASLDEFERIYRDLGIEFDEEFYESELEEESKEFVHDMQETGIAEISDQPEYEGAVYVDLAERTGDEELGKLVVLRKDGTTLYSTKDLALARKKFRDYDLDRSFYVVASEQKLHLRQVFAILDLMGFEFADRCEHIPYELVVLPEGKMSSRSGNVVLFDELWETAVEEFAAIAEEKGYTEPDGEAARKVALGAIKYYMLAVDNNKQVVFDFEEALNPEGRSGVYLQYSYVRANRIRNKLTMQDHPVYLGEEGSGELPLDRFGDYQLNDSEAALLRKLGGLTDAVEKAEEELDPSPLAHYGFKLAQSFSEFYNQSPVLQADSDAARTVRTLLVEAYLEVITTVCEDLLGIELPEAM